MNRITKHFPENTTEVIAYKVFDIDEGKLTLPYFNRLFKDIKYNKWLLSCPELVSDGAEYYTSGFHAFYSLESAVRYKEIPFLRNLVVKRVRLRGLIAEGVNGSFEDAVVAKEMMVLNEYY